MKLTTITIRVVALLEQVLLTYIYIYYLKKGPASQLGTFEARGKLLPTSINKQAQRNGNVKVDAKDVGFNGSAEADSDFKIEKPSEK